jgi:hypothetical protein
MISTNYNKWSQNSQVLNYCVKSKNIWIHVRNYLIYSVILYLKPQGFMIEFQHIKIFFLQKLEDAQIPLFLQQSALLLSFTLSSYSGLKECPETLIDSA